MWLERALSRLGDENDSTRSSMIRAFEIILLMQLAGEHWRIPLQSWQRADPLMIALASGASLFALVGLLGRRREAFLGLVVIQLGVVWAQFPRTGNHKFLELFLLVFLCLADSKREEGRALLLGSLRWIVLLVFFFAGIQKAVHGYYFRGDLLAFYFGLENFRLVLEPLLPQEEVLRLSALTRQVGGGPFGSSNLQLVLISNLAWVGESVLALLLLFRRTRVAAIVAAVGLVVMIELAAHELYFGALYMSGLLLFLPVDLNRRLIPAFAALYAWLVLMGLSVLPRIEFY